MNLSIVDILLIIVSICLFFITVMLNREYYKNYNEDLENVIQEYKDSLKIKNRNEHLRRRKI